MELLWRLFVAGVAIVGPTLLFLGLWHWLMRLRDGELVQRVCARMDETPAGVAVGAPALNREARSQVPERQASIPVSPGGTQLVQCDQCGHGNVPGYDFCRECQAAL